ncbi:MAG: diguanylate cyclase [Xanthomonadaceae bacterium]|nr:diguanylate cyclase [Xanthomonadaceae bacterium]
MKSNSDTSELPDQKTTSSDLDPEVLQAALDQAYNAVIVTDATLDQPGPRIVYANPAFARQTGYPVEELIGQTPRIFQGPKTDRVMLKELRRRLDQGLTFEGSTVNYRKDGQRYHVEWNILPVRNPSGKIRYYLSVQHDVSDFIQAQSKLLLRANMDTLTGLITRNHGAELLERQLKLARRHNQPWSVGMVDIDHFKACNDRYGHAVGDEVLKALGKKMRAALRDTDKPIRWGGEEFLLLLPYNDQESALNVAKRMHASLKRFKHPKAGNITISVGVATHRPGDEIKTLVERADKALYRAKHNGRNRTEADAA